MTPAFALTISPARVEITADPGTVYHGEIEIFNEQEEKKTFFTSSENFEPRGDSGAPHFIGAENGLATWIQTENQVTLEPGERAIVPFSISIGQDAEPGGHFAAIFFGSQAPGVQGNGEVSIGGKIGVLILLRVAGDIPEGGGLLEFSAKENKRFFSSLPVTFVYRVNNIGGDRVVPHGEVKIKNTFQITSAKILANEKEGSVLPNSTRKFEVSWGSGQSSNPEGEKAGFFETAIKQLRGFHFGWYTANLDIVWGDDLSQTANTKYNFFIIPWQLLTLIIIIFLAVGFIGRILLKKYNRHIIDRAMRDKPINNE